MYKISKYARKGTSIIYLKTLGSQLNEWILFESTCRSCELFHVKIYFLCSTVGVDLTSSDTGVMINALQ